MPGSNETAVSHELINASILTLSGQLADHQKHFRETTTRLFDKVDQAIDASHENRVHITAMQSDLRGIVEGRAGHLERLGQIEVSIKSLEADGQRREGREGVLAAILRSPFIAWSVGALAVIWAAIKGVAAHGL